MEITIKARDFSEARHILLKYYDKVSKHIVRRPDSNFFDCYECSDVIPRQKDINYCSAFKTYEKTKWTK